MARFLKSHWRQNSLGDRRNIWILMSVLNWKVRIWKRLKIKSKSLYILLFQIVVIVVTDAF